MPRYRELLAQVKGEIDEVDARDAAGGARLRASRRCCRRPRAGRVRAGRRSRAPCTSRAAFLESRIESVRPRTAATPVDPLVPVRRALGVRGQVAARPRLRARPLAQGRLLALEAERLRLGGAAGARRRPPAPLQPPPADPRGRRGRPAEAAVVEGADDRRRRPRLARRPCTWPRPAWAPSASSTRTSSTTRTCSGRCCTPRIASACRRPSRPKQTLTALNPDVEIVELQRAADVGERRPHPRPATT